ncbi:MAG TPA: fused MFS/spermidine synthase, partial [Polyangiaceae bacterium LLY-WYZ-14_1]|nr:fused MFS/spermidine synthase [Polyangiaceae bacterium LLY-WYZ-14_1]
MRALPYVAFFLSGTSSLIFQVIWTRMLHHVFGATSVAVSSVVTAFMIGLGLGAFLVGRLADRIKHPIITYALAELIVGVWAFALPYLVAPEGWLAGVNQALRQSLGAESLGFALGRFACVLPLLLVPTTLMGATLPLLARHYVREEEHRTGTTSAQVGTLYAVNTFGAVAGTFGAGFVLLPTLGLFA